MEDKYRSMTASELASEESFIRWALDKEVSPDLDQLAQEIPHQSTVREARSLVRSLSSLPAGSLSADDKLALWEKINDSISQLPRQRVSKRITIIQWSLAAAACLALLIWINTTQPTRISSIAGQHLPVALPEGSHIVVNAQSAISYGQDFTADREVRLKGEAFFTVKPGSTFKVITSKGTVTVLGTSFNVIARGDEFEVSCYTGKVLVESKKDGRQEITAGQKVEWKGSALETSEFQSKGLPSWLDGKFTFENASYDAVTEELSRQYGVSIKLEEGLETMRYTGLFEKGNLDTALYMITWPLHLQYTVEGNTVRIKK